MHECDNINFEYGIGLCNFLARLFQLTSWVVRSTQMTIASELGLIADIVILDHENVGFTHTMSIRDIIEKRISSNDGMFGRFKK